MKRGLGSKNKEITSLKENKLSSSFHWLNTTQFLGALNDNIFKLLIVFYLITAHGAGSAGAVSATAGAVFVVPFLLFSSLSGILADRMSKRSIVVAAKIVEVAVMSVGVAAFYYGSEYGLYVTLFLMALQSTLFSPSKYGIVPELVKKDQLSQANSYLEAFTYLAVIIGTAAAPLLSQSMSFIYWKAAVVCVVISLIGLASSGKIEHTLPAGSSQRFRLFFVRDIWNTLKEVRKDRYLLFAVVGSACFMFLGAFAQINLVHGFCQYARSAVYGLFAHSIHQLRPGNALRETGIVLHFSCGCQLTARCDPSGHEPLIHEGS